MEILSILAVLVVIVLVLSLGRFISVALKVFFYTLLVLFVLTLIFGVSFTDLLAWVGKTIFWVF